jgi:predicted RNase H-like HicB family nuclease
VRFVLALRRAPAPQLIRGIRPTRRLGERTGIALSSVGGWLMKAFNAVVERDPDTGTHVGYVPGWPGAHTQGDTLDELQINLQAVLAMLLEDGEPKLESELVGVQTIKRVGREA